MISIDLNKEKAFEADPKATQQISFAWNLDSVNHRVIFIITEEAKETISDFPQGTVEVLQFRFTLI